MNFSYIWFFILFILQFMGVGIILVKLGKEKKTTYSLSLLFFNIVVCVLTGLSIYWWN